MTQHSLECPDCGQEKETMVWDSINVSLDPELKTMLFAAKINLFECEKCQKETFIDAPLLYHDMSMQYCVQYFPSEGLDDEDFFHQFSADGSLVLTDLPAAFVNAGAYLKRPHIVFDMNEMIRYVAFRDRLAALANK